MCKLQVSLHIKLKLVPTQVGLLLLVCFLPTFKSFNCRKMLLKLLTASNSLEPFHVCQVRRTEREHERQEKRQQVGHLHVALAAAQDSTTLKSYAPMQSRVQCMLYAFDILILQVRKYTITSYHILTAIELPK